MLPGVPSAETTAPIDVQRAAWMVGCWELRRPGFVVQESWSSPLGGAMQGVSRTARNDQFLEAEMLLLRLADGKLGYEAFPTGQRPTRFEATTVSDTLFIFENPAHDFPKLIGYRKVGADSMHAWIEGNGRRVAFPYGRARCATNTG
jgi:hypothetical protein